MKILLPQIVDKETLFQSGSSGDESVNNNTYTTPILHRLNQASVVCSRGPLMSFQRSPPNALTHVHSLG